MKNRIKKLKKINVKTIDKLKILVYMWGVKKQRGGRKMGSLLLKGKAGVGKTALAEYISKKFDFNFLYILCHEWVVAEDFFYSINIPTIAKKFAGVDGGDFYLKGILAEAIKLSKSQKVLILVDELDKASTRIDALLLDFLQNCRVRNPEGKLIYGDESNIVTFITSNEERELIDPLQRRLAKVELTHLPLQVEASLLSSPASDFYIDLQRQFIIDYILFSPVLYENFKLQNLIVKVADRMRQADLDISLYELKQFYLHIPIAKDIEKMVLLIKMWLCRNSEYEEFLHNQFKGLKNLAHAFIDLYKKGGEK